VSGPTENRVCPALVAGLVESALRAPDPHGPSEPPKALQRWLTQGRHGSIKVLMALAVAGWVLPILPGTPFFLLAWLLGWRPEPEQDQEISAEAELKPSLLQPSA
jgi:cytochrome b561